MMKQSNDNKENNVSRIIINISSLVAGFATLLAVLASVFAVIPEQSRNSILVSFGLFAPTATLSVTYVPTFTITPPATSTATLTQTATNTATDTHTPTSTTTHTATATYTSTPADTATATNTSTPTVTPTSAEYAICPASPSTRLYVGAHGKVAPGDFNNLRDLPSGNTIGKIPPGGEFDVLEGPQCGKTGLTFWKVQYGDQIGWTSEGQGTEYWLEPIVNGRG